MTEWKLFLLKEGEVLFLRTDSDAPATLKPRLQAPAATHLGIILFLCFLQWLAGVS